MNSEKWKQRNIPILLVIFIVGIIFFVIQSFRIPYEARQVTVGAVLIGSKEDKGWNEIHFNGLMNACREQGCELKIREDIQESAGESVFYEAVEELVDEGANVIFLTSFGYGTYLDKLSARYPDVAFFCISGHGNAKNITSYFARLYQVRYLAGVVAGAGVAAGAASFFSSFGASGVFASSALSSFSS